MKKNEKARPFSKDEAQLRIPALGGCELEAVFDAKNYFSRLSQRGKLNIEDNMDYFWSKLVAEIYVFLLDLLQDLTGREFYLKKKSSQDDFEDVHPAVIKLANGLIEDKIIKEINYAPVFNDLPKIYSFSGSWGDYLKNSDSGGPGIGGASGSSLRSREEALMRYLGEAMERTCSAFYKNAELTSGSYKDFRNKRVSAVNPANISALSENQLKNPELWRSKFNDDSVFRWVRGISLISNKNIFIPAQLVYVPYRHTEGEPVIRSGITTGTALHTDKNEAIYRGLCEVVERDAFMIFYLNKLSPPRIDLKKSFDGKFFYLEKLFRRYGLELNLLDITTDIGIPVCLTLVLDRNGNGPVVMLGNKADLDSEIALEGSVEEVLKSMPWSRRRFMESFNNKNKPKKAEDLANHGDRMLFWSSSAMIKEIEFLLEGRNAIISKRDGIPTKKREQLDKALEYFRKNNSETVAVDITVPEVKKRGFTAFSVVVPSAQPLYLNERLKCLGGKRLYGVPVNLGYFEKPKKENELNEVPHPFL